MRVCDPTDLDYLCASPYDRGLFRTIPSGRIARGVCERNRVLDRRHKLARFRDPNRSLDTFDFDFNKKMNRALVYEVATSALRCTTGGRALPRPAGTGKSHLAQAIGRAAIQQGYRVIIYTTIHAGSRRGVSA